MPLAIAQDAPLERPAERQAVADRSAHRLEDRTGGGMPQPAGDAGDQRFRAEGLQVEVVTLPGQDLHALGERPGGGGTRHVGGRPGQQTRDDRQAGQTAGECPGASGNAEVRPIDRLAGDVATEKIPAASQQGADACANRAGDEHWRMPAGVRIVRRRVAAVGVEVGVAAGEAPGVFADESAGDGRAPAGVVEVQAGDRVVGPAGVPRQFVERVAAVRQDVARHAERGVRVRLQHRAVASDTRSRTVFCWSLSVQMSCAVACRPPR